MIVSINKKATFNYFIEKTWEAGIQLYGTEISVIRKNSCSIKESFIIEKNSKLYLHNFHVPKHNNAHKIMNHDPYRDKLLLLHKNEIIEIITNLNQKHYSIIPLKLYFNSSKLKIEIALGKGKKLFDKRNIIKNKENKIELQKILKSKLQL